MTLVDVAAKPACAAAVLKMAFAALAIALFAAPMAAWADGPSAMYRLYNPYTGEHFYTADVSERNEVMHAGWRYEGVGWAAPAEGEPVYRLYNPFSGEHHYTLAVEERDYLTEAGWDDEGTGWYSDPADAVPLYREYNPNMVSCNHNYTTDRSEHESLVSLGWVDEGIAWHGLDKVVEAAPFANPESVEMPKDITASLPITLSGTRRYVEDWPVLPICGFYYLDFDEPLTITCKPFRLDRWTTEELDCMQAAVNYNADSTGNTKQGRGNSMLDPYVGKHVVISGSLMSDGAGTAYYSTDVILHNITHVAEL